MKSNVPMPIVAIVIVVLVALAGFVVWKGANRQNATNDIQAMTKTMNEGKEKTQPITAGDDLMLKGGGSGGKK